MNTADHTQLVAVDQFIGEDPADTSGVRALAERARSYLQGFGWCGGVQAQYVGYGVPDVIGLFLVRIVPNNPGIDEWLWVVVGDLPSAYLVTDKSSTPDEALQTYVELMRDWVRAVESGGSFDEVYPVEAPRTSEAAAMLSSRLGFIENRILKAGPRRA